mmetsp:Transcript_17444/g.24451  ORF Transcript_17444/g.24451 Transcript_17444/m.24451 type:complete len:266 (+) Transcript_17444:684-1481(+)
MACLIAAWLSWSSVMSVAMCFSLIVLSSSSSFSSSSRNLVRVCFSDSDSTSPCDTSKSCISFLKCLSVSTIFSSLCTSISSNRLMYSFIFASCCSAIEATDPAAPWACSICSFCSSEFFWIWLTAPITASLILSCASSSSSTLPSTFFSLATWTAMSSSFPTFCKNPSSISDRDAATAAAIFCSVSDCTACSLISSSTARFSSSWLNSSVIVLVWLTCALMYSCTLFSSSIVSPWPSSIFMPIWSSIRATSWSSLAQSCFTCATS